MKKASGAQLCFDYFLKARRQRAAIQDLLKIQDPPLRDSPEDRLTMARRMGRARTLLRSEGQLLLRDGDEYWIARPKVDARLVERRLKAVIARKGSSARLAVAELKIAGESRLIPELALAELKKSAEA